MSEHATTPKRYRLLRVIEYVGDAEFVRQAVERRLVKGRYMVGSNYIQEAIIGETGELISEEVAARGGDRLG